MAVIFINVAVLCFASQTYNTINVTSKTDTSVTHAGEVTFSNIYGTYTRGDKTYNEKAYSLHIAQNGFSKIDVTSGNYLYGRKTLSDIISQYQVPEGYRVVGAVNADFFSNVTGLALGLEISDGIIKSTNSYSYERGVDRYTLGFNADGTAVIGQPNLSINVTAGNVTVKPGRVNSRPDNNFVLLTDDYGDKTYWNTAYYYDVIELKASDSLRLGKTVAFEYVAYYEGLYQPIPIQEDHFYLITIASDKSADAYKEFTKLKTELFALATVNESVSGSVAVYDSTGGMWANTVTAIGGGNLLINNGVMRYPSTYDSAISNTLTSRTAVGILPDSSVVFYCVERSNESSGVPIEAVTQALYDMGCVYAINFDGGGSTTILAGEKGSDAYLRNLPQDGAQRKVANAFVLLARDFPPEILNDFEQETAVVTHAEGKDVIEVKVDNETYETGKSSLRVDYKLGGFGHRAGFDFKEPIDVAKFSNLSFYLGSDKPNTGVSAVLEINGERVIKDITELTFDGFSKFTLDVSSAQKLLGFEVYYRLASDNIGTVFIDRLTGYTGNIPEDNTAPDLTVTLGENVITAAATDNDFPNIKNIDYEFYTDGTVLPHTLTDGIASVDTSALVGDRVVRVNADAYDFFGNRARKILLFKSADYTKALPFADMTEGKWDELYIRYCAENAIINGITENGVVLFKGTANITRAEFCIMLVRSRGIDINLYQDVVLPYEDVADIPFWALPYAKAAYAEGIMMGIGTYTGVAFNGKANITRQEAACAIDRMNTDDTRLAMKAEYTDTDTVAKWASESVISLSKQGVFGGDSDGGFHPTRTLTRSEAATIMTRI